MCEDVVWRRNEFAPCGWEGDVSESHCCSSSNSLLRSFTTSEFDTVAASTVSEDTVNNVSIDSCTKEKKSAPDSRVSNR